LSDKKTQLVVQREQENNPDRATVRTPSLEMENCTSIQNTPGSGRYEIVEYNMMNSALLSWDQVPNIPN
jgi:hypothetical protein